MKRLRAVLSRIAGLFSRARRERDLAAELESHLALHIDDNLRQGMAPEEARRQALLKLGGLEQAKELLREQSGIPWLEHLAGDFRYAARSLNRNRGSAAAIVLLLALGIGGATALFGPLYSLVLSPLPFPHSDRIVRIGGSIPVFNPYTGKFAQLERLHSIFAAVAAYGTAERVLFPGNRPIEANIASVTPELFAALGVKPWLGRAFTEADAQSPVPPILVSYRLWRTEMHGAKDAVGRPMRLGYGTAVVVGVMPRDWDFPAGTDAWFPWSQELLVFSGTAGRFNANVLGLLRPGLSLDRAATELNASSFERGWAWYDASGPLLETLQTYLLGDRRSLLLILWAVSVLFLLLACAGAANLLLARGVRRQPEMVVRLTLGAVRGRLIRQLLAETLLLAAAGGLLGVGLAVASARWMSVHLPAAQGANSFSLASFGLVILLAVVATILCGLAPAFGATGGDLNSFLKTGTSGITRSAPRGRLFSSHEMLAGGQLVLATVLLVATGLLLRSLVARLNVPLGFQPQSRVVVEADFPPEMRYFSAAQQFAQRNGIGSAHHVPASVAAEGERLAQAANHARHLHLLEVYGAVVYRLSHLPGAVSAAYFTPPPFAGSGASGYDGHAYCESPCSNAPNVVSVGGLDRLVSPGALETLGLHLLAGRYFVPSDALAISSAPNGPSTAPPCIINEALAKLFWPHEDPVGKQFFRGIYPRRVVGVVADVQESAGRLKALPTVYYASWGGEPGTAYFVVELRPGISTKQFAAAADQALMAAEPDMPRPTVVSLEDLTTRSLANLRLALVLLGCFSVLGTIVAALGVYAAATLMAAARTREMGIRIALGAQTEQIRGLAVWRSVRLALVALPLGALCAWGLARSLSHWLFQIGAADPATYATSIALVAVIALAAGLVPARRAARVDPVVALREE